MDMIRLFVIGICIGMANVIPGVSGGTLAVVFNIYDRFINAITYNVKKLWANKRFVGPLLSGMALGVLLFSKLITVLYENFPVQTNFFFTGLIIGSLPMIFLSTFNKEEGKKYGFLKISGILICIIAGLAALLFFSYLEGSFDSATPDMSSALPELSVKLALRIFIAGYIGAIAMVIPGISGSLLMLILGVYTIVMKSIPALFLPSQFFHALFLLLPNGIGVLIGLICGAKLVAWLLKKAPNHTYGVIFGLLLGSAVNLFPGFSSIESAGQAAACLLCLITGACMAYFSGKLAPAEDKKDKN